MIATCKILLWSKPLQDGTQSVYLRVSHNRKSKYFTLRLYCKPEHWDAGAGRFTKGHPRWREENDLLRAYEARAHDAVRSFQRDQKRFTFEELDALVFGTKNEGRPLVAFIGKMIVEMDGQGRHGNARAYKSAMRLLELFNAKATLSDVNDAWLKRFEGWMRNTRGNADSSIMFAMCLLRSVCNRAIKMKVMPRDWSPFETYPLGHLKKGKTPKAADLNFIRALEGLEPNFHVDLFLLSFYLRGINMADLAELRVEDVYAGRISYTRKKTHRSYSLPVNDQVAAILARWPGHGYLLPILIPGMTEHEQFLRRGWTTRQANRAIRAAAAALGFEIPGLTFYTARHTYATSLKRRGVATEVISEALGHADLRTTDLYLKSFEDDVLDQADKLLLG